MGWSAQPVCDGCWKVRNGERVPVRLKEPDVETCCYCGLVTRSGIYVRENTDDVPFPSFRDEA